MKTLVCLLPFFVPELGDEFLVALTERWLLVGADQSAAVQKELSERRTVKEQREK